MKGTIMDDKLSNAMIKGLSALDRANLRLFGLTESKSGSQRSAEAEADLNADTEARERIKECDLGTPEGIIEALRIIGKRLEVRTKRGLVFTDNTPKLVEASIKELKQCQSVGADKSG